MSDTQGPYASDAEIEGIVYAFESCAVAPDEFKHAHHLLVAFWYLRDSGERQALRRMRRGLLRLLDHHGIEGVYHETITLFWLKLTAGFLRHTTADATLADTANRLLRTYGDSKLINAYYSPERLASAEARAGWVEPDLRPLTSD